jgi:excisionase family DNA binding protein
MLDTKDELLTVAEAARLLKVTPHTIYRWIGQGRLRALRYSRRVLRVRRSDLEGTRVAGGSFDSADPPKGSGQALLRFAGILTHDEAEELRRVIMEDRIASLNDPH